MLCFRRDRRVKLCALIELWSDTLRTHRVVKWHSAHSKRCEVTLWALIELWSGTLRTHRVVTLCLLIELGSDTLRTQRVVKWHSEHSKSCEVTLCALIEVTLCASRELSSDTSHIVSLKKDPEKWMVHNSKKIDQNVPIYKKISLRYFAPILSALENVRYITKWFPMYFSWYKFQNKET